MRFVRSVLCTMLAVLLSAAPAGAAQVPSNPRRERLCRRPSGIR